MSILGGSIPGTREYIEEKRRKTVESNKNSTAGSNYTVGGIEYDWKTGRPATNDKGEVTRQNQLQMHRNQYGGLGLGADYKKAEEQAFKGAKAYKDEVKEKAKRLARKAHPAVTRRRTSTRPKVPNKFRDLRYPYSTITSTQDFLKFSIFQYVRGGTVTRLGEESNLKSDLLGNIFLPIPSQLVDSNKARYGDSTLNFIQEGILEGGASAIGGDISKATGAINTLVSDTVAANKQGSIVNNYFATQAVNALLGSNLTLGDVTARMSGNILNPNMELLFQGPTLRDFTFQFKFTPRFQREAETVRHIIKAFKRNMAPRNEGANLLKTPNIFEIQYIGKASRYLNRMKLCALKDISMNYTADGTWATYQDGSPVSMTMTLAFTELTPVYNEDYRGYSDTSDGVGY